jgi:type VII secretion effector (TIGR04197 family)
MATLQELAVQLQKAADDVTAKKKALDRAQNTAITASTDYQAAITTAQNLRTEFDTELNKVLAPTSDSRIRIA